MMWPVEELHIGCCGDQVWAQIKLEEPHLYLWQHLCMALDLQQGTLTVLLDHQVIQNLLHSITMYSEIRFFVIK